jgi:hypothetical protein
MPLVVEQAEYFPGAQAWLRDRGDDPDRLVAMYLPDAAPATLKGGQTKRRSLRHMSAEGRLQL